MNGKRMFEELKKNSNFNEQVLNVNTVESNVIIDEKITNEIKVLQELKENLNFNEQVSNIEGNVNN